MKIYRVHPDLNKFQSFFLEDKKLKLEFDGKPMSAAWKPPAVFVLDPKQKKGSFFGFGVASGAWIADAVAVEELRDLLEMSGELLPLTHKGEHLNVVNVLECINILDHENTEWSLDELKAEGVDLSEYNLPEGYKGTVERYAFHADRLTETPLFKIPETSDIFTVEGMKDPEDEFKPRVERAKLKGLLFKELWSDES